MVHEKSDFFCHQESTASNSYALLKKNPFLIKEMSEWINTWVMLLKLRERTGSCVKALMKGNEGLRQDPICWGANQSFGLQSWVKAGLTHENLL